MEKSSATLLANFAKGVAQRYLCMDTVGVLSDNWYTNQRILIKCLRRMDDYLLATGTT